MEIRLKYNGNKIDIKRVIYPYFYFISPKAYFKYISVALF